MDNISCISEVLGVVEREGIIKYVEKNWRTMKFEPTIENLLKKFEESIENRCENSTYKKKYRDITERWRSFLANSKQNGTPIAGHFDDCRGDARCYCSHVIFGVPREITCEIVNAYYSVRCIVEQVNSFRSYEEIATNLDKDWRRMNLKMVIKGLLKILRTEADFDVYVKFSYLYEEGKFKDPDNMIIDHCQYACQFVFDDFGLRDCHCTLSAYKNGPVSFIRNMVGAICANRKTTSD